MLYILTLKSRFYAQTAMRVTLCISCIFPETANGEIEVDLEVTFMNAPSSI